jgi:KaiC/GvpD/RAD55 family RecA-like ATPase
VMTKVENIIPTGFQIVTKPDYCSVEGTALAMVGKKLDPLKTDEIAVTLKSFLKGSVEIKPKIVCFDETGHQMTYSPEPVTFIFLEAALPGLLTTGYTSLDNLLLGGIPENYTVILTSPSCDEREELIKRFLQSGLTNNQITFYITREPGNATTLAAEFQSTLYLFICNPQAEAMAQSLPNVFKLKGVENLTEIDIAMTKVFRSISPSITGSKRICIEIISDALLQHHAVNTRRWLSALLPTLKSKGFTILAVINQQMHPPEEVQAILDLFEGEIRVSEKETPQGTRQTLKIRKLYNRKYLENEIVLTKEMLSELRRA